MAEPIADFGAKLTLALKHLSLSRGQLASALGVHKSLVGRWASGAVHPSGHNLARLTQRLQCSIPGLTLLSWEKDVPAFAALIGAAVEAAPFAGPFAVFAGEGLSGHAYKVAAASRVEVAREGRAYAGLYRMYRQAFNNSGIFILERVAIRLDGDRLTFRCTDGAYEHAGAALLLRGQLFLVGEEHERVDEMFFMLLNGIAGPRALRLDGILLSVAGDRTHTPAAMIVALEREADLASGAREDESEWQQRRAEILALNIARRGGEAVPEELKPMLENRVGAPRQGGGVDWVLRVPVERTISVSDVDVEAPARRA